MLRDVFGDADDRTDTRVRRFDHRGRSRGRRDENERRNRPRSLRPLDRQSYCRLSERGCR
jgi:hypothetical protein